MLGSDSAPPNVIAGTSVADRIMDVHDPNMIVQNGSRIRLTAGRLPICLLFSGASVLGLLHALQAIELNFNAISLKRIPLGGIRQECTHNRFPTYFQKVPKGGPERGRPGMLLWYLKNEASCGFDISSHFDIYQFGVPTEMQAIIELLRLHNVASNYTAYWGFDSFQGLPREQDGVPFPLQWKEGQYSAGLELSPQFWTEYSADGSHKFVPKGQSSAGLKPSEVVQFYAEKLSAQTNRIKLVSGFYNESIPRVLHELKPAIYIDINCDLYISTMDALVPLFSRRLVLPGTIISYDDWFLHPTVAGGEIKAHLDVTNRFMVCFEELQHNGYGSWNLKYGYGASRKAVVFFRVRSIGYRSCHGISMPLANALNITKKLSPCSCF